MHCPKCGAGDTKVIDSRPSETGEAIRRRRECVRCHGRFTTYERREEIPLIVIKSSGLKEPFDRQKIIRGLVAATIKRNIELKELDKLIDTVEDELREGGVNEVRSTDIGSAVLKHLLKLDKVAYVRFASVYRDFKDVEEFTEELRSLNNESN